MLAAAEHVAASGDEFLTALVIGYEIAIRAGLILHPLYGFYHGTGAWAPVGAAAAAARLLGCTPAQTWHALGIAEFHAPMTPEMRSVDNPSMLKDGIGWAGTVGLAAAQLASHGFSGIPSLFDADLEAALPVTEGLGRDYLCLGLYFKPYACCRWAQPAVEGALAAVQELVVTHAEVARVQVHTFAAATHLRCVEPESTEEAQFSLPWPVACALVDGEVGPDQVLEDRLRDPVLRRMAGRVEMIVDPALEQAFPERALAWVTVESADGRRAHSGVLAARGDADAPLSDGELGQKFTRLAAPVLGRETADEIALTIGTLPQAPRLDRLTRLLQR